MRLVLHAAVDRFAVDITAVSPERFAGPASLAVYLSQV
jgi:hypothetical protein